MLVRITNREDTDLGCTDCLGLFDKQLVFDILEIYRTSIYRYVNRYVYEVIVVLFTTYFIVYFIVNQMIFYGERNFYCQNLFYQKLRALTISYFCHTFF